MSTDIQKPYVDKAMFQAAPIKERTPQVHLLWMTPDPLGAIAAACRMYEGKPTYSLADITDEERGHYWKQARATHLKAPLEFVKFHFFIEGVDRALTHQMVRQRTAVYAQESMRFAVKDSMVSETSLPPSLIGTIPFHDQTESRESSNMDQQQKRDVWDQTLETVQEAYDWLIERGMPAEDARGLLPHATLTRLNYSTDLRALLDHAGNRLCTQAQFHWRALFVGMITAIRDYPVDQGWEGPYEDFVWQWDVLSEVFRPVCYEHGRCPFQADFDRGCTIRERADRGAFDEIDPSEWLLDPKAGFVKE